MGLRHTLPCAALAWLLISSGASARKKSLDPAAKMKAPRTGRISRQPFRPNNSSDERRINKRITYKVPVYLKFHKVGSET